jgi:hypothetical protein
VTNQARLAAWERRMNPVIIVAAILPIAVALTRRGDGDPAVWLDLASWAVFVADFVVHLVLGRRYLRSKIGVFDLMIVVLTAPWYLIPGLGGARVAGIARLGRLARVLLMVGGVALIGTLAGSLGSFFSAKDDLEHAGQAAEDAAALAAVQRADDQASTALVLEEIAALRAEIAACASRSPRPVEPTPPAVRWALVAGAGDWASGGARGGAGNAGPKTVEHRVVGFVDEAAHTGGEERRRHDGARAGSVESVPAHDVARLGAGFEDLDGDAGIGQLGHLAAKEPVTQRTHHRVATGSA